MKPLPEIQNIFYQNLGKLFYSIAAADKVIKPEEVAKLKQLVNTEWLEINGAKDKDEIDAMRQIKIVFNAMIEQNKNAAESLQEFKLFKKQHEELFSENVKQLIWKTANSIASSFSRRNKSELIMLSDLSIILKSK